MGNDLPASGFFLFPAGEADVLNMVAHFIPQRTESAGSAPGY